MKSIRIGPMIAHPADHDVRRPRVAIYVEPRDVWVGVYVAWEAVYICPLPMIVIRWARGPRYVAPAPSAFVDPWADS